MPPSSAILPPLVGTAARAQRWPAALQQLQRPRRRMAEIQPLNSSKGESKLFVTSASAVQITEHVVESAADLSKHRAHWWVPPAL